MDGRLKSKVILYLVSVSLVLVYLPQPSLSGVEIQVPHPMEVVRSPLSQLVVG